MYCLVLIRREFVLLVLTSLTFSTMEINLIQDKMYRLMAIKSVHLTHLLSITDILVMLKHTVLYNDSFFYELKIGYTAFLD